MITLLKTPRPSNKIDGIKAYPVSYAKAKTVDVKTPLEFAKVLKWAKKSPNHLIILGYSKYHGVNESYIITTKDKESIPYKIARTKTNFILSNWKLIDIDNDDESFETIESSLCIEDTPRVRAYSSKYYMSSVKRKHIFCYLPNINFASEIHNNDLIDQSVISSERIVYVGLTTPHVNDIYIEAIDSILDYPYIPAKEAPVKKTRHYHRPTDRVTKFELINIEYYLSFTPSDDYNIWRKVGAILESLEVEGDTFMFYVFDRWSQTSDKYDINTVRLEWEKFSKYSSNNRLSIKSLSWLALPYRFTDL